ncbi:MAG: maleylacetoacetate isomerase [Paracoccus sp. (in: a-proteobacteria)]|nr:maleylacetoacetate isomerase [Paracoccus sp. (in: a-proteobacteria)]
MPEIVLYDYWRSSASYRVRIALALKGLDYDRVPVDLLAGAQRGAEHLALNPQGAVPVMMADGARLTQSLAIIEYLDEARPTPPLLPTDPVARAQVRALAMAIACEIHPLSNLATLARIEGLAGAAARAEWNRNNIARGLETVEAMLTHAGAFCHGDAPGLADCALIPQLYNATRWGVGFDHLPRIARVSQSAATHPAFIAAHPDNFAP